jgi:sec-independent protein translocase protein TatC
MDEPAQEKTMSLWDHLEELRWAILKCFGALLAGTALCFAAASPIYELLAIPLRSLDGAQAVELVFSSPSDAIMIRLKLAIFGGVVLALPAILAFVWTFVAPGLKMKEKRLVHVAVAAGTLFFCAGAAVGYAMLSFGLATLVRFGIGGTGARHLWTLRAYLDFCLHFMAAFGAVFELPIVLTLLSRLGVVTTAGLRRARPYAIVGAFVVGGILTPPDPYTQTMLAMPLLVMYEASVWASAAMDRRKIREAEEEVVGH